MSSPLAINCSTPVDESWPNGKGLAYFDAAACLACSDIGHDEDAKFKLSWVGIAPVQYSSSFFAASVPAISAWCKHDLSPCRKSTWETNRRRITIDVNYVHASYVQRGR